MPAYGLWSLVIINSPLFIIFAASFTAMASFSRTPSWCAFTPEFDYIAAVDAGYGRCARCKLLGSPRLAMLAAVALTALAQFYLAVGPHGDFFPIIGNVGHGQIITTHAVINGTPAMIGWSAHPQAWLVLPLVAAAFWFDWNFGLWWMRLRYPLAFVALFWSTVPIEARTRPTTAGWP